MTDRYSKLIRAFPTGKTTFDHVATVSIGSRIDLYGMPVYVLTDNKEQFASKLFATLLTMLDLKRLMTAAYYPLIGGLVKRYSRTVVNRLRHCVAKTQ